ncbi:MAG: 2,3-bisphosphoglycerate-independent phosphoglycerate mutase [Proteobacteria bacterium]|nr:2,3-bisphosphoglycerate-independent phosphoglycerate mutase [Pseudomonadota bacterium]
MSRYKTLLDKFAGRRPLINIILDGYGLGKEDRTNAIYQASTPFIDFLMKNYANTTLLTHGKFVGLPGEKDLGSSEVGHLTMGAGKIVSQGPTLITDSIKDGSFFEKPVLKVALEKAASGALHLIGLLSDGNVHSHISHFEVVIEEAVRQGVEKCYFHALLDGRDVGPQSAHVYIERLERQFHQIRNDHPDWEYGFASGGGREVITMDRDTNWVKVEAGWNTHVLGNSGHDFPSAMEAIRHFRSLNPDLIDQDCPPFNIRWPNGEIPRIRDGEAVIFMNFRADRAVELTRAFTEENFEGFTITDRPDVYFAGMMVYDEDNDVPQNRIMGSPSVPNPFGRRILDLELDQFRLAETQKYAHVTFFFNGGYRNPLNPDKETYHLIDSDRIDSFALAPRMKAVEITLQAVEFIKTGNFDFGLINFANTDMVGHTGDMKATMIAAETVDSAVKRICEAARAVDGIVVVTADHGNADEMILIDGETNSEEICTKHSINPVPFIIYDPSYDGEYSLKKPTPGAELDLSMISATNFILLGRPVPSDVNDSLFQI